MSGEHDDPDPYAYVNVQIGSFANLLIENGARHNPAWRRAVYEIPPERVSSLYQALIESPLGDLLYRPGEVIPSHDFEDEYLTTAEYAEYGLDEQGLEPREERIIAGVPLRMELIVDEDRLKTPAEQRHTSTLRLLLVHNEKFDDEKYLTDRTSVNLHYAIGSNFVERSIFMYQMADTGYEGHGFKKAFVSPEELMDFYELVKANCGPAVPQTVLGE